MQDGWIMNLGPVVGLLNICFFTALVYCSNIPLNSINALWQFSRDPLENEFYMTEIHCARLDGWGLTGENLIQL